jgi:hypothetical protein
MTRFSPGSLVAGVDALLADVVSLVRALCDAGPAAGPVDEVAPAHDASRGMDNPRTSRRRNITVESARPRWRLRRFSMTTM